MHEGTFRAIESGATVITASRRLARVLTQTFHAHQRELARSVWKTPDILPLDAFLSRTWREYLLRGETNAQSTLLDPLQEEVVWEEVIRDASGDTLLQIPETARSAMDAWRLVQAYRLPVDGRFEASEDWAAFASWSRAFRKRCQAKNWIEGARLADVVAELFRSGNMSRPGQVYLAGFDEVTPQQKAFFDALGDFHEIEQPVFHPSAEHWKLPDSTAEIRAAAGWARAILEKDSDAQIAVIVPDLTRLRSKVDRIFSDVLAPGGHFDDTPRAFHVSLGPSLQDYPAVHAALLLLEFGAGPLTLPRIGMLLRSAFLAGADTEWTKRALLDAELRRNGVWELTPSELISLAERCPQLQRALIRFEKELATIPQQQRASEWSGDFSKLLDIAGWPGSRTLTSREYQVIEAWQKLLSKFAALDVALPPMTFHQAFDRLRAIAAESTFQVENEGAPVQIMGLLEASGLGFDHLWVMGLHDEALPAAANPNPFLPSTLQREHKLPHSSAEHEFEFANQLLDRLRVTAQELVFSYPETEGDRALSPSPLVVGPWADFSLGSGDNWVDRQRSSVPLETLHDEQAPPASGDSKQRGGVSLFKDMAACPFRTFAKHRLGARPLEETDLGLSYRDRGNGVHRALEFVWAELGSHARLLELTPGQLQEMIARNVADALAKIGIGLGRKLEQRRLEKLLAEWVEIEKSRQPFIVQKPEQERVVTIGGVQVRVRADRIDELPDGRDIILDYKTGQLKLGGWDGDRPDEPQVPLYCATSDRPIAGAAFVLIRIGELAFRGVTEADVSLPEFKKMNFAENLSFAQLTVQWRRVLEKLAVDFRAGHAEVDPKPGACEYCGLRGLCRIREVENDRG